MRLKKLTPEDRKELADLFARNYSVAEAHRIFYAQRDYIPDEERYPYQSFLAYRNSPQGKQDTKDSRTDLQKNAPTSPYVHRGERLSVLNETLGYLLGQIRLFSQDTKKLIPLSSETRQVIREIREEAVPYDTEGVGIRSPWEDFAKQLANLTPEMQDFIATTPKGDPN